MDELQLGSVYREAQESVLGSLLIDPEAVAGIVFQALAPSDFDGERRTVFEAMRQIWSEGSRLDVVIVMDRLGDRYAEALRTFMRTTPTAANVAAYCEVVREQAALRRLRDIGAQLANAVAESDARRIIAKADELLIQRTRQRVFWIQDLIGDFYGRMGKEKPKYIPWGLRALDEKLTCEPGDLVILGADSSVGKTALALKFAWHMASRGYRVGFFSLETQSSKLCSRLVAQRARVNTDVIKAGSYQDSDYKAVLEMGAGAGKLKLDIIEASGFTAEEIRVATVAGQYQVIFIDYLQLLQGEGNSRPEIVSNLSMAIHTMAQDLGVTVVALSQITPADKTAEARRTPGKEALRESRQLIHDADIILMMSLYDPDDNTSLRWLNCRKNKEGELPHTALEFDPKHMDFQQKTAPPPSSGKKKAAAKTFMSEEAKDEERYENMKIDLAPVPEDEELPL